MTASAPESVPALPACSARKFLLLGVAGALAAILTWPLWSPVPVPAQPLPSTPSGQASSPTPPTTAPAPPPRPVETVSLTEGAGIRSVLLIGQVESSQQATIRAQTSGIVREIRVQPGDRITPGMTLAVLDDADQKLALARAQAQLAVARARSEALTTGVVQTRLVSQGVRAGQRADCGRDRAAGKIAGKAP